MRPRKTVRLSIAVLLTAGMAWCADAATGHQSATTSKAAPKASNSAKHKGRVRRSSYSRREKGQKAPTPDRISEIQQALAKEGSFTSRPNGKWDASTTEAMKRFQSAHGLNPTGKLDALTLQKLGLGSKTAGVAAPTPSADASSSLLTSPSSTQTSPQQ